ncbi:MAG: cytochrome c oxidase subunit 3 [Planctomycetota bacterium]|nr:cytochrome c oxidase subunit 3 [Planctomycetota bacterium]
MMHTTTTDATHAPEPSPFLAHHFESQAQQFDAGKLGIWLFLVTEILFFSGLFVAYAVYRSNHPEVFLYAHQFLDKTLGAVNTVVLLFSSLTMAWGVRCAQLGRQRGLVICLILTLVCAAFFLGVKAVEYTHKWDEGLLWASQYAPQPDGAAGDAGGGHLTTGLCIFIWVVGVIALAGLAGTLVARVKRNMPRVVVSWAVALMGVAALLGAGSGLGIPVLQHALLHPGDSHEPSLHKLAAPPVDTQPVAGGKRVPPPSPSPRLAGVFFSIYFAMTGVHAIHILAGMGVILWITRRAMLGHFGPGYFGPVDYVGLYWHLVDLVWIYLFPLLYLIH